MARYLVTGGGGFVGKALCFELLSQGNEVISVARGAYPELEKRGVRHIRLDLCSEPERLLEAMHGCEAVFHVAAKVDMWGPYQDFFNANVQATRHVISCCRAAGVRKLIFTSSPSVIADGNDLCAVDESYPYPQSYLAYYPMTKAQAEKEVLEANSPDLMTVALRPHLIWGPGDTNLIPTILDKARKGKLIRVGKGQNLTDLTYIDDCISAHILAMQALSANSPANGKAYFISQGDPVNMWNWINQILQLHGLETIKRSISKPLAMSLAFVLEIFCKILPGHPEPLLTRFLVCEMSTSHYFNISRAKTELGYQPKLSVKEALEKCFG